MTSWASLQQKLQEEFKTLGLELTKFVVENISLPEEVEAAMDKRTSMGVLGDMGKYTQFEAAQAMRDAAQNPSGGAGLGAGLGAGFAVGNAMAGAMSDAMRPRGSASDSVTAPSSQKCIHCGAALQAGAKFCSDCGTSQLPAKCTNCQNELKPGAKFCDECGTKVG
jgi:membrane protease subunit (stomatin/prohibitin family)